MAKIFHSLITAIDVGTTKISVLIGQKMDNDEIQILGIGKSVSDGLDKGVVVDVSRTVQSISRAVKEAELMAGCPISAAYVGISGSHISSFNTHGAVPIKNFAVTQTDVQAVLAVAQAVPIEEGQKILHAMPQFFMVDGKDRVTSPVGLHGIRLEAKVHIITGAVASIQNLIKCCQMAGVRVADIVLEQIASAHAVLSLDEQNLGVGILDIGGGTSDFAVYQQGSIRYTKVIPIAGNFFTKDLAVGLRATVQDAERFKREHGIIVGLSMMQDQQLEVAAVDGKTMHMVSKIQAGYILQARALELFSRLQEEIKRADLQYIMTAGLVLTGGGSLLQGMEVLAEKIFKMPARIGNPRVDCMYAQALSNPIHATGYGLLKYALKKQDNENMDQMTGPVMQKILVKMRSWVDKFF